MQSRIRCQDVNQININFEDTARLNTQNSSSPQHFALNGENNTITIRTIPVQSSLDPQRTCGCVGFQGIYIPIALFQEDIGCV